ncbi:MAG: chromate efflux transporter [Phycisphaerales bacterium]|jgi:chromate transporter
MLDGVSASRLVRLAELARAFAPLGLTSFGGPVAHFGYFHRAFVVRRSWFTQAQFTDLVALCQFLPGPASSQFVFAAGLMRAGLPGGILAAFCFSAPSIAIMLAFAMGVTNSTTLAHAGFVHGFKLAAVGVVAHAVLTMWRTLCPDLIRTAFALAACGAAIFAPAAWWQPVIIALAGLLGLALLRPASPKAEQVDLLPQPHQLRRTYGAISLSLFAVLFTLPHLLDSTRVEHHVVVFNAFYRSGALVFGGGHVVLPLLHERIVNPGWVNDDQFLAGYGMAQAIPGPLFCFAAHLGAVIYPASPITGGIAGTLAIFLPGWLLIAGVLPFWASLKQSVRLQRILTGFNASVVGILLAALYRPLCTSTVHAAPDVAVTLTAFAVLALTRVPPIVVIALCGVAGQYLI